MLPTVRLDTDHLRTPADADSISAWLAWRVRAAVFVPTGLDVQSIASDVEILFGLFVLCMTVIILWPAAIILANLSFVK